MNDAIRPNQRKEPLARKSGGGKGARPESSRSKGKEPATFIWDTRTWEAYLFYLDGFRKEFTERVIILDGLETKDDYGNIKKRVYRYPSLGDSNPDFLNLKFITNRGEVWARIRLKDLYVVGFKDSAGNWYKFKATDEDAYDLGPTKKEDDARTENKKELKDLPSSGQYGSVKVKDGETFFLEEFPNYIENLVKPDIKSQTTMTSIFKIVKMVSEGSRFKDKARSMNRFGDIGSVDQINTWGEASQAIYDVDEGTQKVLEGDKFDEKGNELSTLEAAEESLGLIKNMTRKRPKK